MIIKNEMKNLIYIDTFPHFIKSKALIDNIEEDSTFLTTNKSIYNKINNPNKFYINPINILKLAFLILHIRSNRFFSISVARTDSLVFQLLFIFCSFKEIYTFDEGLYTINEHSIYNSQFKIERTYHTRLFLLNKILNFPIPAAYFYKKNSRHYTWFAKSAFSSSIIDENKIIELDKPIKKKNKVLKIMVGQPWHYMLSNNQISKLFNYINSSKFDIYLQHPREKIDLYEGFINEEVSILKVTPSSEDFLNFFLHENVEIFSLTSTLVCNVPENFSIFIIEINESKRRLIYDQENLYLALNRSNKAYKNIHLE